MVKAKVEGAPPGTFLRIEDFPGSRRAVETIFSRLASGGPLVRVRRGLYWKGVNSRFGLGRPKAVDVALAAAGRGAGPTGWSASHALGLSTQVPAVPEVAVVGSIPTGVRDVVYRSRRNIDRVDLADLEIAILEVLREFPTYVEGNWEDLVLRIDELRSRGLIDIDRLARVGLRERSAALRACLARLLSDLPETQPA